MEFIYTYTNIKRRSSPLPIWPNQQVKSLPSIHSSYRSHPSNPSNIRHPKIRLFHVPLLASLPPPPPPSRHGSPKNHATSSILSRTHPKIPTLTPTTTDAANAPRRRRPVIPPTPPQPSPPPRRPCALCASSPLRRLSGARRRSSPTAYPYPTCAVCRSCPESPCRTPLPLPTGDQGSARLRWDPSTSVPPRKIVVTRGAAQEVRRAFCSFPVAWASSPVISSLLTLR